MYNLKYFVDVKKLVDVKNQGYLGDAYVISSEVETTYPYPRALQ